MNLWDAIILGFVQGVTEFLPISSSGHLVIFQSLLGLKEPLLLFDAVVHAGTLSAVIAYFWRDLWAMVHDTYSHLRSQRYEGVRESRPSGFDMTIWVIIGSIPTALIGLLFRSPLEEMFASLRTVGIALMLTALLLIATRFIPGHYSTVSRVGWWRALVVGAVQGMAIIPGISRSGSTIVAGLLCGMERELAGRFSFLLSIPAIIGALLLQAVDSTTGKAGLGVLLAGYLSSSIVGFLSLKLLMVMVRKGSLFLFAPYCTLLGLVSLWGSLAGG